MNSFSFVYYKYHGIFGYTYAGLYLSGVYHFTAFFVAVLLEYYITDCSIRASQSLCKSQIFLLLELHSYKIVTTKSDKIQVWIPEYSTTAMVATPLASHQDGIQVKIGFKHPLQA